MNKKVMVFPTSWGWFRLVLTPKGVYSLRRVEKERETISHFIPERIKLYLRGAKEDFRDIPVDWEGYSQEERKVLEVVREIPYGKTKSYRWVAKESGFPNRWRWVGRVLSKNRTPLIIPCHRVIRSDGKIGGFSWGGEWKEKLLELERGGSEADPDT